MSDGLFGTLNVKPLHGEQYMNILDLANEILEFQSQHYIAGVKHGLGCRQLQSPSSDHFDLLSKAGCGTGFSDGYVFALTNDYNTMEYVCISILNDLLNGDNSARFNRYESE